MTARTNDQRQTVRSDMRRARRLFTGTDRHNAECALRSHILALVGPSPAGSIGTFVGDDGEPDLGALTDIWHAEGAAIALPSITAERVDRSMCFRPWLANDELGLDRFAIPTPVMRAPIDVEIVLVPLVAFDNTGNRLGRGAGFYDRFLDGRTVRTVGVAFELQRIDCVPVEAHDQPLDVIVTELGIRNCAARRRSVIDTRSTG